MEANYELSDESRSMIIDAAQKAVDALPHSAGGVVVGFVLVVESVKAGDSPDLTWVSGDGMPTAEAGGGLARWRLTGMLRDVCTQVDAAIWRWRLRDEE